MILTAIPIFITSLLQCVVIYFIGKILCQPTELRQFLGINKSNEDSGNFQNITVWLDNIGQILKLIAVINGITALITLVTVFSRF